MTIPQSFSAFLTAEADTGAGVQEVSSETLEADELQLRVHFSSVNFKDALASRPDGKVARKTPLIPGIDLVGEVLADAGGFSKGELVISHGYDLGVAHHGGFAEYARIDPAWALPLPQGLSPRESMIFGTAGFTAALSIMQLEERGLTPKDGPVLVTGATGGVGSAAVAMLAARGYTVTASTGKKETAKGWLMALGAAEVIDRVEVPEKPKPLNSQNWAAAVDSVGGAQLAQVLSEISYGGAAAISGVTAGPKFPGSVFPHILRGVAILGTDSVQCDIARRREVWEQVAGRLRPAKIDDLCADEISLDGVSEALEQIFAGQMTGRTVVRLA
ncbi:acryloyl-CoA reductase [Brevibacterium sp. CFH 10365]|uniref:acrylyl-CoA reductase family protein n=1 Tax=Brevibacterium sp. CFH 10365 TaxID=2585207 RepID=UPI00126684E2|nr:acryloyl-CoA reductase [Brevibacterium sp. CFH 10365]